MPRRDNGMAVGENAFMRCSMSSPMRLEMSDQSASQRLQFGSIRIGSSNCIMDADVIVLHVALPRNIKWQGCLY